MTASRMSINARSSLAKTELSTHDNAPRSPLVGHAYLIERQRQIDLVEGSVRRVPTQKLVAVDDENSSVRTGAPRLRPGSC